mgnify:CR=1 FL=1
MEKTEILVKVQDIFRDVLDNEEIVLNNDCLLYTSDAADD